MANPLWFDETFYAAQKVAQMNATGYVDPATGQPKYDWAEGSWADQLAAWNTANNTSYSAYDNFVACNESGYNQGAGAPAVTLADINVSPNQYFNVGEYCQNLADYANVPGNYDYPAPEGGWTAQNVLQHMLDDFGLSAWDHFCANWATQQIDPSASFDLKAYLATRAEAMGNGASVQDAIAALNQSGDNPIQDYFNNQAALNLPAPAPGQAVSVPSSFQQWGSGGGDPQPADPFEQNVTAVGIEAGALAYPAEGEAYSGNTMFEAKWLPNSADSTLNVKDVITGPEGAWNTLAIDLGKSWSNGFNGVKQEDGTTAPSVTNVGRVQLNHSAVNPEASWTFNARNISEDAYRFDLNGANGPGSISLKELSDGVTEIRISNLTPKDIASDGQPGTAPTATTLDFAQNTNTAKDDALTLVIDNVQSNAAIKSSKWGIENLTIDTVTGDDPNMIDIRGLNGVKSLAFTGQGNITVTDVAEGIKTYDASQATGNVNMAVRAPSGSTVVRGGQGNDTVTLTTQGTWTPASLESIEELALTQGGVVNLKNVDAGLTDIWTFGAGGQVKNLSADNIIVHQQAGTAAGVVVDGTKDGSLGNLTYVTAGGNNKASITGNITSNATGDVTVSVQGKDEINGGTLTFKAATGTLTFNEGENGSFGANVFADQATTMIVNAENGFTIAAGGSLKAMQNVTLNLEDTPVAAGAAHDATSINVNLPNAQNITVNAGGQNVTFADLGNTKSDGSIVLDVNEANSFTVGDIKTSLGANIDINIEAEGTVTLGSTIENSTNVVDGGQGDIRMFIAAGAVVGVDADGDGAPDTVTIDGGPMDLNFGDVAGDMAAVSLESAGTISYIGAAGDDHVTVVGLGQGMSSFNLGEGADKFTLSAQNLGAGTATVSLVVDGNDEVSLNAATSGILYVNVDGWTMGVNKITANATAATEANVRAVLSAAGVSLSDDTITALARDGKVVDADSGTGYAIQYTDDDNFTLVTVNDVDGLTISDVFLP